MTELNLPFMAIRKKLSADEGVPPNTRVNPDTGEVESTIDGGATWQVNPEADPRKGESFYLPPGEGACAVATGMVTAMQSLAASLTVGSTVAGIATTLLAATLIFLPVSWLFISFLFVAGALLTAGGPAVFGSFTTEVWEDIRCILYCNLDDQFRLDEDALNRVREQIALLGIPEVVTGTNFIFEAWGWVGLTNAGVLNADPEADCDGCPGCEWTVTLTPDNVPDGVVTYPYELIYACNNVLQTGYGNFGQVAPWLRTPAQNTWRCVSSTINVLNIRWRVWIPIQSTVTQIVIGIYQDGAVNPVTRRMVWNTGSLCQAVVSGNPTTGIGTTTAPGLSISNQWLEVKYQLLYNSLAGNGGLVWIQLTGTGAQPIFPVA